MGRCKNCDSYEGEYNEDHGYCNYYRKKVKAYDEWGCYSGNDDGNNNDNDDDNSDTGCYLTTLMCELLGYEDDCFELTYLRDFRQNYMQNNIEGQKLLSQYKDISHPIVKKLHMRLDKKEIALKMKNNYIISAIERIENGNPEGGIAIYKDMVAYLQSL